MGKSIHGMRARSRDRARAHHNGRVSSRLFLTGCSPAEPASASPADATLRLHPPQCQRNFIERYFVTVLVVSAQGSTARNSLAFLACRFHSFLANFADRRQSNANFSLGRSGKVTMRTSNAVHCLCDGADRRVKSSWDGYFFAGERVKHRQYSTGLALVFSRQVQLQPSMNSAKQDLRLQGRALAIAGLARSMVRDKQLVGPSLAQYLHTHQHRCYDDGV